MQRLALLSFFLLLAAAPAANVVFIHPDGAGLAHWQAARLLYAGPDGDLHWDHLPHIGVYRGHMSDNLTATSNGGATVHAFGVKAPSAGFGSDGRSPEPLLSAGGSRESLLTEALRRGVRGALINSGSIIEPGTAVFASSVAKRSEYAEITRQVIQSGVDLILSGGEEWMLPTGQAGRHVASGLRPDGLDLIAWARQAGYTVVYDRAELASVPASTRKLLGVFAAGHTFHDRPAAELRAAGLPLYVPSAPTLAEMTAKALELLAGSHFFLVIEEEGSDNFGNANNAPGVLAALGRTDEAFGVLLAYVARDPATLLITAADSEAGNMDVIGLPADPAAQAVARNGRDANGAPYEGDLSGQPFLSAPDRAGLRHPFVVSWGTRHDSSGAILVRAAGAHADQVRGSFDNTAIYRLMRAALFAP